MPTPAGAIDDPGRPGGDTSRTSSRRWGTPCGPRASWLGNPQLARFLGGAALGWLLGLTAGSYLDDKAHTLVGKQVLTTAGYRIGTISDVDFDPTTGAITALLLGEQSIDGRRLIGAGSYAVIIAA